MFRKMLKNLFSDLRSSEHVEEVMGIDEELEKRMRVQESLFSDSIRLTLDFMEQRKLWCFAA